ncbi:helix-turn-helix domain-containing protein [Paenibacillus mesotrionivorans]|uniref:Helix-turn-helix domain-containing protein n=1 Tax=Paenibacillus mesotrionivorans TaxID=3160968 RepID=A0ACC7NV68_9BACL
MRIALQKTLDAEGITKGALAREAKVRPNFVYELCEGKTRRIDLDTLNKLINTLNEMSGKEYDLSAVLEYIPE